MPERVRMSHVDAAWLHAERPDSLVVIHGLLLFGEPLVLENVYDVLQTRLIDNFPRFRRRVVRSATSGKAWWEDVPDFDVRDHVTSIDLGDEAPEQFVSRMMSIPLDLDRPAWQLYVLNMPNDHSAIFVRVHHIMGDGIALVRTLFSMTDGGEYIQVLKQPSYATSRRQMLIAGLRGIGTLLGLIFKLPDNKSAFKGETDVPKAAAWSRPINLADVKSLRDVTGGTVNDVLLTAITGALRQYALAHSGVTGNIRTTIPVNLRPLDGPIKLGNKFGLVFLTLPIDEPTLHGRVREIKRRMNKLKKSAEPIITYGLLDFFGRNPPPIIKLYFKLFAIKATGVTTNVPGPTNQVTFAETPMDGFMFWVPMPAGLGIGISILSYNGEVRIGIVTDAKVVPNPELIIDAFYAEFDKLLALRPQLKA